MATFHLRCWFSVLAAAFAAAAWPIARHVPGLPSGDFVDLDAGLRNAIVRIRATYGDNRDMFAVTSGSIVGMRRDAQGRGGWLSVLTTDHAVGLMPDGSAPVAHRVGFGNAVGAPTDWEYEAPTLFRHPRNPDGTWVDLAVLGVRVGIWDALPLITPFTMSIPVRDGILQAGYGNTGAIGPPRRYDVAPGYGTYRNGHNAGNALLDTETYVYAGTTYSFSAITGALAFSGPTEWPPSFGESHTLQGDSGGPSLQWSDSGRPSFWNLLVGVHSTSARGGPPGAEFVTEGSEFADVRLSPYIPWINGRIAAIPEPTSVVSMGLAIALLAFGRRRPAVLTI